MRLAPLLAALVACHPPVDTDRDPDTSAGTDPDTSADTDTDSAAPPLRYVRLTDESAGTAEIDAVVLRAAASADDEAYAAAVVTYAPGEAFALATDPEQALGAPDAFPDWPDTASCPVFDVARVVSLRGAPGALVLELARPAAPGDTLIVLERGGCSDGLVTALTGQVAAAVGPDPDVDAATWVELGAGTGPAIGFTIP